MIWGICLFLLLFLGKTDVQAGCETSISSDGKFLTNSSPTFQLTIKNTGEADINWIKIPVSFGTALSSIGINGPGWNPEYREDSVVFTNWYLPPGQSVSFDVQGATGETPQSFTWTPMASTSDEENAFSCSGSDVSILTTFSTILPPQPVVINGVMVTVESGAAIVRWQTDVNSSGSIEYGESTGYGQKLTDDNSTKDHSLKMTGLTPSTTYHYRIASSNNNGTTTTDDFTLTTSSPGITQAPIVVVVTNTVNTTVTNVTIITPTPSPKPAVDSVAPVVRISTTFDKPYKTPPLIDGVASDGGAVNVGVEEVEYSTDDGKNWSPVDYIAKPGAKSTSFSFTPPSLDDGSYPIKVRASDKTKNIGISKTSSLTIDRLPPQAGNGLFLVGPLLLKPNNDGQFFSVAGTKVRTVWSAVGGPLKFNLNYGVKSKELIKNGESGLWEGEIEMANPGLYEITTDLNDGINPKMHYDLGALNILAKGKIMDVGKKALPNAKLSVYVYESSVGQYVLWNAAPYSQVNPQLTALDGSYSLFLPEGKYFLEIESKNSRKVRTTIFSIDSPTPIIENFNLEQKSWLTNWWAKEIGFAPEMLSGNKLQKNNLVNKTLPDFDLGNGQLKSSQILGKKTIILMLASWMPDYINQLSQLEDLRKNNQLVEVLAVFEQESVAKVENISKMENLSIKMIADPDGVLTEILGTHNVPTNVFLDRKGIINDITSGYLDNESLKAKILF